MATANLAVHCARPNGLAVCTFGACVRVLCRRCVCLCVWSERDNIGPICVCVGTKSRGRGGKAQFISHIRRRQKRNVRLAVCRPAVAHAHMRPTHIIISTRSHSDLADGHTRRVIHTVTPHQMGPADTHTGTHTRTHTRTRNHNHICMQYISA